MPKHPGSNYEFIMFVCSAYGSTVPEDLFNALEEERMKDNTAPHTVYDFFTSWTTQPGYPVINVTRNGTTFTVSQVNNSNRNSGVHYMETYVPLNSFKKSVGPLRLQSQNFCVKS